MGILKPFILEDFDLKKPFSSFLPGLAGIKGIPLWTYYVNRGQGVTSVGSKDKNGAILEFNPACISYEKVATQGFRTFIKIENNVIEAFSPRTSKDTLKRRMYITGADMAIEEINEQAGYKLTIKYFGLPNMPIGSLVRRVELESLKDNLDFDFVDGTSQVLPHGVDNGAYKDCGNLMRSWMDVYHINEKTPFYTMRSSSSDEAEISEVVTGNFYLATNEKNELMDVICDGEIIFGHDTSRQFPIGFYNKNIEELFATFQYVTNKIPCAFVGVKKTLNKGEKIKINSMLGFLPSYELLENNLSKITSPSFFDDKELEAQLLIKDLTDDVATTTSHSLFDEYVRQSYLDNFLRGGYPVNLGSKENPKPYYIYSRKHGDPERDYNWFNLEPEYYSQGNGNFRDINQNRRNDVIFNDFIQEKNIKLFMNLIALDGYNPLVINGSTYLLNENANAKEIVKTILGFEHDGLIRLLSGYFTPGGIINYFVKENLTPIKTDSDILYLVLENSSEQIEATFGEGYWIDHFTYNLDLIETYLWLYPEKKKELLFNDSSYRYFYNPVYVLPRNEKIGLTKKGTVRQYGSTGYITQEEKQKIKYDDRHSNWVKDNSGNIYSVNLASKLISLILTKFPLRDPYGYGIMMEANKPGWNDAMNGLPGILSSGVSETIELKRVIDFVLSSLTENKQNEIKLPLKLASLSFKIKKYLIAKNNGEMDDFEYYDVVQTALEEYRLGVRLGIVEESINYQASDFIELLELMKNDIVNKLELLKTKYPILPTYLTYDADQFVEKDGMTPYGLKKVEIKYYKMRALPYFLEAPARYLKTNDITYDEAKQQYERVRQTELYDQKLKMYRTSEDLDSETLEIGRIRAFTKGWLERESNFMHMTFKYLYGLLKSHLYDEFFEEIKSNFPPFMDSEVYGRSVFENSSFIATSCNPNPSIHGEGFVARLSGSNTEILSMWLTMMFGYHPFKVVEGELHLQFKPILPIDFFKDRVVSAKFLKTIEVIYENLTDCNTFDDQVTIIKYELIHGNEVKVISAPWIVGQDAIDVRNKKYSQIKVYLGYNKF